MVTGSDANRIHMTVFSTCSEKKIFKHFKSFTTSLKNKIKQVKTFVQKEKNKTEKKHQRLDDKNLIFYVRCLLAKVILFLVQQEPVKTCGCSLVLAADI